MDRVSLTRELGELKVKEALASHRWLLVCDEPFHALFREWGLDAERLALVGDMEKAIEKAGQYDFCVVCTEKGEGPVQQALKEKSIANTGFYNQMIPKLAAGLPPRFHPPRDASIDLEFAIMCLPRCGSTLVSRELKQIGAGNPVEHFRGFVQDLLRERDASRFNLIKWWSLVQSGRQVNCVFGTKVIYDFWKMAEKYMLEEEKEHMLAFFKRIPIIYIERTDKYAQAVSDAVARRTGVWHLWNEGMKETYKGKLEKVGDDLADAMASYRKFRRSERELWAFVEANSGSIIKIQYEELVKAPKKTIADVCARLGLTVPDDYPDSKLSLQPTTSATHQLLRERLRKELE
ncbi:MAG: Stf0 family sulfotransferase [Caulobacteraceae bacterium]